MREREERCLHAGDHDAAVIAGHHRGASVAAVHDDGRRAEPRPQRHEDLGKRRADALELANLAGRTTGRDRLNTCPQQGGSQPLLVRARHDSQSVGVGVQSLEGARSNERSDLIAATRRSEPRLGRGTRQATLRRVPRAAPRRAHWTLNVPWRIHGPIDGRERPRQGKIERAVRPPGLEPGTCGLRVRRSNQLS